MLTSPLKRRIVSLLANWRIIVLKKKKKVYFFLCAEMNYELTDRDGSVADYFEQIKTWGNLHHNYSPGRLDLDIQHNALLLTPWEISLTWSEGDFQIVLWNATPCSKGNLDKFVQRKQRSWPFKGCLFSRMKND